MGSYTYIVNKKIINIKNTKINNRFVTNYSVMYLRYIITEDNFDINVVYTNYGSLLIWSTFTINSHITEKKN